MTHAMRRPATLAVFLAVLVLAAPPAYARGPCAGKKGGVSHCADGKFMCKDGSVSRTKKQCDKAPAASSAPAAATPAPPKP